MHVRKPGVGFRSRRIGTVAAVGLLLALTGCTATGGAETPESPDSPDSPDATGPGTVIDLLEQDWDRVPGVVATDEEFTARVDEGAFLEWVEYVSDRRYGTLRSEIERIAGHGRVCVLELETDGALRVQADVPGACTIFIAADVEELERRLRDRATESTGEIGERIAIARNQLEQAHRFRYMVRNDDIVRAGEVLAAVVERELALASASSAVGGTRTQRS